MDPLVGVAVHGDAEIPVESKALTVPGRRGGDGHEALCLGMEAACTYDHEQDEKESCHAHENMLFSKLAFLTQIAFGLDSAISYGHLC